MFLLCLGERALQTEHGPTAFIPMNDLRLILPQENPPQTCDLVRDVLEVLAVLEDPKGQNCKGTKCLGVGGEAG